MAREIETIYKEKIQDRYGRINRGADVTKNGWTEKENEIQEDFIWGIGLEILYQMTRAEYKTEPDKMKIRDLIRLFIEYFSPKRNNTTTAENSSGPHSQKPKHRKTSGGD